MSQTLRHKDGTAYIRTVATENNGWQKSHVHRNTVETYIVQHGWIALAEIRDKHISVRTFNIGEIITTQTGITHNVFLSPDAVIHTVKHGNSVGNDRESGEYGEALDIFTEKLNSNEKIRAAAMKLSHTAYSKEYKHFDNLIWQVPSWATAIFALSLNFVAQVLTLKDLQNRHQTMISWLSFILVVSLLCFSFVLSRFRIHQRPFRNRSNAPIWKSGATWMQNLINLEAVTLFGVALILAGLEAEFAIGLSIALGVATIIVTELTVRRSKGPTYLSSDRF